MVHLSCPADHRLCMKQSDRVHAGESCWGSQHIAAEQTEHRCRNRAQVVYRKTGVQVLLTKAQGVHREQAQGRLCRSCRTCHRLFSAVLAALEFSRHMHRLLRRMQTCRFLPSKCGVCTGMFHQIQGVHRIQEQGINDWWWFVAAKGTKIKVSTHLSSILMAGCLPLGLASGFTDIQECQAATPVRLHKLGLFDEQSSVCVAVSQLA